MTKRETEMFPFFITFPLLCPGNSVILLCELNYTNYEGKIQQS